MTAQEVFVAQEKLPPDSQRATLSHAVPQLESLSSTHSDTPTEWLRPAEKQLAGEGGISLQEAFG